MEGVGVEVGMGFVLFCFQCIDSKPFNEIFTNLFTSAEKGGRGG